MPLKKIVEWVYRSSLGRWLSVMAQLVAECKKPRMIYGFSDPATATFRKYTRVSDSSVILEKSKLTIGDHVWVGHYSILDASESLIIEEGCQLAAWVGIYTHSSHIAIRLYGKDYINVPANERLGYTRGAVKIGAYTFVGAGAVILPGVIVGKGCMIASGAVLNEDVPDGSIVAGNPGKVVGLTQEMDRKFLVSCNDPGQFSQTYYDADLFQKILTDIGKAGN